MKARCKFGCESVQRYVNSEKVILRAHYDPSLPEDQKFSKATPSGSLEMLVDNPQLHGFFVPGQAYYLDVTAAD